MHVKGTGTILTYASDDDVFDYLTYRWWLFEYNLTMICGSWWAKCTNQSINSSLYLRGASAMPWGSVGPHEWAHHEQNSVLPSA